MKASEEVKGFVHGLGIDLVGIADLEALKGMPTGIPVEATDFFRHTPRAIILGVQYGKYGKRTAGRKVSHHLEATALTVAEHLSEKGYANLVVRCDEEFDPVNRHGLLSLKVLAKAAGLGWQGRSLLIISPEYGPVHRWVAILTDMDLQADSPLANHCGDCPLCVEKCPVHALTLVHFEDHPQRRDSVLDIHKCLGDDGCKVCMLACPWMNRTI